MGGKIITLGRVQSDQKQKLYIQRAIYSAVISKKFTRLWGDSTNDKKLEALEAIKKNRKAITKWMENHPALELGERSLHDLKVLGQDYNIRNWSRLGKTLLIQEIQEYEKRRNDSVNRDDD